MYLFPITLDPHSAMYFGPSYTPSSVGSSETEPVTHSSAYRFIVDSNLRRPEFPSSPGSHVALVVKNDLDSLCAAMILRGLLSASGVLSLLWPITDRLSLNKWQKVMATRVVAEEVWQERHKSGTANDLLRVRLLLNINVIPL